LGRNLGTTFLTRKIGNGKGKLARGGKPGRGRFPRGIYIQPKGTYIYIYFLGNSSF